MNNSYYIESPWDSQWIVANNDIVEYITHNRIQPTGTYEDHTVYNFDIVGKQYLVLNASRNYITTINRLTDMYYTVQVKINNQYVVARPHQREALIQYVMTGNPQVCVPHTCGGDFIATFRTIDQDNFEYVTEDGTTMQMRRVAVL